MKLCGRLPNAETDEILQTMQLPACQIACSPSLVAPLVYCALSFRLVNCIASCVPPPEKEKVQVTKLR